MQPLCRLEVCDGLAEVSVRELEDELEHLESAYIGNNQPTYSWVGLNTLGVRNHLNTSLTAPGREGAEAELGTTRCERLDDAAVSSFSGKQLARRGQPTE